MQIWLNVDPKGIKFWAWIKLDQIYICAQSHLFTTKGEKCVFDKKNLPFTVTAILYFLQLYSGCSFSYPI